MTRGMRTSFALFRSNPGVAVAAIAALAMGIGFTTTMFSIVHGATRTLPLDDPDEIVAILKLGSGPGGSVTRSSDYAAWAAGTRSFDAVAAFENVGVNLASDSQDPERITGAALTASAFPILGVSPAFGRVLQPADMVVGANPVVVLSDALWRRRFGADPAILGRSIRLTGVSHTVVGVMPPRFAFPIKAGFWVPLQLDTGATRAGQGRQLQAFARLADGRSLETARAELNTIVLEHTPAAGTAVQRSPSIDVVPFVEIETPREVVRALYLMLAAVSFVLLIACSNVANLLIARAAVRSRDVAVRLALGATRSQIVLAQLGETAVLSVLASLGGLALAHAGTRVFARNTAHIIEAFWVDFRVDGTVALFASILAASATIAAGLGPALRASTVDVVEALKDRGAGTSSLRIGRLSRGLIAGQIALTFGLLALTATLGRTAVDLRAAPWPFEPERILSAELGLTEALAADPAARNGLLRRLSDELEALPGVEASGLTTALPGRGAGSWTFALDRPEGQPSLRTGVAFVTPGFFEVVEARVLAGRGLTWRDDGASAAVAVVNESFVRRFSDGADPIGRRVFLGERAFTIVGVIPDLMAQDVQESGQDGVYMSMLQSRPSTVRIVARGTGAPMPLVPLVRDAVRRVDPELPVQEVFSLHEAVYREKRVLDVLSTLFLLFGVGALALTAVGFYGVISFCVTQRTREIGIRVALGATRAQVLRFVVRQGSGQLAFGLAAGLALALLLSQGFAAAVEGIAPAGALLLASIAAGIGVTALLALIVPVRRALSTEIAQALRVD